MLRFVFIIALFFVVSRIGLFAFEPIMIPPETLINQMNKVPELDDEEGIVNAFQASFIREVFLKQAFTNKERFFSEDNAYSNDYGIYDEIIIRNLATKLAEQDVLNLKEILKKEIKAERR